DPEDSLIMENEELNTIPEKESDEFIKSSVEDLILIPSESEDTSGSDSECILPSDDESLSDKDVPEDNVLEDIECKNSYDPNLDESAFLVIPFYDSNKDEYFTLGDDVELLLYHDPSIPKMIDPEDSLIMENEELNTIPEKESDEFIKSSVEDLILIPSESEDTSGSDSECILPSDDESLSDKDVPEDNVKIYSNPLFEFDDEYISSDGFTDELPLKENDDLFDLESKNDDWKKIFYDAPINDLITKDKVFDLGIHDQMFSLTYSEDTIFDPGISAFHFSHRSGTFIRIAPDLEASRARGFVHRPLDLLS
nr:hypothetical protein [Tanacetum cinerariifolium]